MSSSGSSTGTYANLVRLYELMLVQNYTKEQEKTKRSQTRTVKVGTTLWCLVCRSQDNLVKLRYEPDPTVEQAIDMQEYIVENYIEMIYSCFNIEVIDEDGGGCICEGCIGRLRDAVDFKKRVEEAEEILQQDLLGDLDLDDIKVEELVSSKPKKNSKPKREVIPDIEIMPPRLKSGTSQCPVCGEIHLNSGVLRSHYIAHFHPCQVCPECGKRYITQKQLNQHIRLSHRNKQNICQVCGKDFQTNRLMQEHIKKMHEKRRKTERYQCDQCADAFATIEERRRHKVNMHNEKTEKYECNICNKTFFSATGQRYHIKTVHMGVKKFSCPVCHYKCASLSILKRHQTIHNPPTITCNMCPRMCKTEAAMMEHMKLHTDAKCHLCVYCGASFAQARSLASHLIKTHKVYKKERPIE